jgi:hypothetical protein
MAIHNSDSELQAELVTLLKKQLVLRLFELNVPQVQIAKKLKINIVAVNSFLKGIKKAN